MAMTIMPTRLHLLLLLFVLPFMGGRPRRDLVRIFGGALPGYARCVADESETAAEEERVWISLIKCLPPSRCCYYWPPTWRLCRGSTRTTASGSVCSSSIHGRREEDNVPHNLPPLAEPPMPPPPPPPPPPAFLVPHTRMPSLLQAHHHPLPQDSALLHHGLLHHLVPPHARSNPQGSSTPPLLPAASAGVLQEENLHPNVEIDGKELGE